MNRRSGWPGSLLPVAAWLLLALPTGVAQAAVAIEPAPSPAACSNVVTAHVYAIDHPIFYNRLGAMAPQGKLYVLAEDLIISATSADLRPGKRPRPLVLRVNQGECLEITFTNRLSDPRPAGIHVIGMQWVRGPQDDGSNVGLNASSLVTPGATTTYKLFAEREGAFLMYNTSSPVGGEGDNGTIADGLFGAVNVEPAGSEWYRSQVTRDDLALAITAWQTGPDGEQYPQIDYYNARYSSTHPDPNLRNRLILRMRDGNHIVHSDLTAIITGPGQGNFGSSYPETTKVYPNRAQPFREFTIVFHDEVGLVQAFPHFQDRILQHTLHSVRDAFAINYGTGGIGAEILANRLGVGPMRDCTECKYEEFFLTSWVVGDPAMVVDTPANAPCTEDDLRLGRNCTPTPEPRAEVAFYPDDPSNVYHSYLNDHVKFRNLHAGSDDHHIFHLHAHQWLHTPRADRSSYLDSQAIGQGTSFTYEIAYEGSGNRNKTAGDSIFHCHFYPHFAQGMWSLWRVHDVLELGTELDGEGKPVHQIVGGTVTTTTRALPDAEILTGTPIPALVPIPTQPQAPVPGNVQLVDGNVTFGGFLNRNPGYPFWIPGKAGRRPPHPPLDFAVDPLTNEVLDGGLARHVVLDGTATSVEERLDFSKTLDDLVVAYLPETGTAVEVKAMNFHGCTDTITCQSDPAYRNPGYLTPKPNGSGTGIFQVNAAAPQQGAPFADPCIDDSGEPITDMRYYRAADIQVDTFLNKGGWHFPQQRMIALWNDVGSILDGSKPPEPFFFRAESQECVEFWLTNLVPNEYHLDDFQVRTPTDVLGQHIHLVKFDVTSSDGSANGWNYEDGTFSPEEVQERICAIRMTNANECGEDPLRRHCNFTVGPTANCPKPKPHPAFPGFHDEDCDGDNDWLGAQTTVQRWWVDPVLTKNGTEDRTLTTVFTHDHFGPSTHQQGGLYAGLVVEPRGTTWIHNETGDQLSVDPTGPGVPPLSYDGGPTSWQAVIQGPANYREFMLEFGDFQLAYEPGSPACPVYNPGDGWADPPRVINPPGRKLAPLPQIFEKPVECPINKNDPDGSILGIPDPRVPCPEAISADDPGMFAVNYRNEPVALRVRDPDSNLQATGRAGDLSFAYSSLVDRADDRFDVQPNFYLYPLTFDMRPGDPYTPLLRAYEGDRVHIRVLVGAHEEEHNFTAHDMKWLFEPDYKRSGYKNSQQMGISEKHEMEIPRMISLGPGEQADFLYKPSAAVGAQWTGDWGMLRLYRGLREDLQPLSSFNPTGQVASTEDGKFEVVSGEEARSLNLVDASLETAVAVPITCPATTTSATLKTFDITAVSALEVLQDDPSPVSGLVYNQQARQVQTFQRAIEPPEPGFRFGPLHDPTAIMFVYSSDLNWVVDPPGSGILRPRLRQDVLREPLVLRANAGDCIRVTLRNKLPDDYADMEGWNAMPMIVEDFNANSVVPSMEVGLHPQLVFFDVLSSDGSNVGFNEAVNRKQTVAPDEVVTYHWYAGDVTRSGGSLVFTPVEFGATGLTSSDPIKHTNKGAVGALIIEPQGALWTEDTIVIQSGGFAKEVLTRASATVTPPDAPAFREFVAIWQDDLNLRFADDAPVENLKVSEDATESGQKAINYRTEPLWFRKGHAPDFPPDQLPDDDFSFVFSSAVFGDPETRVFEADAGTPVRFRLVHPGGHTQAHVPEIAGHIWQREPYGPNSLTIGDNPKSELEGTRHGFGPTSHFDAVLFTGAGGRFAKAGDYIYKDYPGWFLDTGIWGILRIH